MPEPAMSLIQGTLDVLILKAASWGSQHGYGIARLIEGRSEGTLRVEEGALYQALHRLERQGLLASSWGASENNRRAKYYELTSRGRARLRQEASAWARYSAAVFRVLEFA